MKNAKKIIATALLLAILASQSTTVARADSSPGWDNQKSTFTAGVLKAVFEGNQPRVKFTLTTDSSATEYDIRFKRLTEFNDLLGTGIFHSNESVNVMAELDVSNWIPTFYPIKQAGNTVGIGVNFTNNVPLQGASGTVPVTLVARAYNTTHTETVNGKTVTIEQAEIKVDVIISNWPFGTESNPRLALQINLHSERDTFETQERDQVRTTQVSPQPTGTSEQEFKGTDNPEQEVRFAGAIGTTGMIGFFRFVSTATVNHSTTVSVLASYKGERESEGGSMESEFAVFLSYPEFTGTLEHDPSFGFTSAGIPLLLYVLGGAVIVAAGVVILLRRTRPHIQLASL